MTQVNPQFEHLMVRTILPALMRGLIFSPANEIAAGVFQPPFGDGFIELLLPVECATNPIKPIEWHSNDWNATDQRKRVWEIFEHTMRGRRLPGVLEHDSEVLIKATLRGLGSAGFSAVEQQLLSLC